MMIHKSQNQNFNGSLLLALHTIPPYCFIRGNIFPACYTKMLQNSQQFQCSKPDLVTPIRGKRPNSSGSPVRIYTACQINLMLRDALGTTEYESSHPSAPIQYLYLYHDLVCMLRSNSKHCTKLVDRTCQHVEYIRADMAQLFYLDFNQVLINFSPHITFILAVSSDVRLINQNYSRTKGKQAKQLLLVCNTMYVKQQKIYHGVLFPCISRIYTHIPSKSICCFSQFLSKNLAGGRFQLILHTLSRRCIGIFLTHTKKQFVRRKHSRNSVCAGVSLHMLCAYQPKRVRKPSVLTYCTCLPYFASCECLILVS